MPDHVEEREFTLRLVFRSVFAEGYEGEVDGFAWTPEADAIAAEAVRAAAAVLRAHAGWRVVAGNRGRPAEDEITLELTQRFEAGT
jgi:hypothetical protein